MAEDKSQDYVTGELRGDVNAILRKLEEIEGKIDGTHSTHDENYRRLEERVLRLEKFRHWVLGACGVIAGASGLLAAIARMTGTF